MSRHAAFRRQPVDPQVAQQLRTIAFPAPTRGLIDNENEAFAQPGGAVVLDNWAVTTRGVKLRGGLGWYCDLHALDIPKWLNNTAYVAGNIRYDVDNPSAWTANSNHTSAVTGSFAADRLARPTLWSSAPMTRLPVISAFEYVNSATQKMYAANATKLYDVTTPVPALVRGGNNSGNWCAAQLANAAGGPSGTNWMIAVNQAGDYPLRFNGTSWVSVDPALGAPADGAGLFTGPAGTTVVNGHGLCYVWKYRSRLFFIEAGSMNAWYLGNNAVGGALSLIPLAGAATKGGALTWGATWSLDAGDGLDEKCVFGTSEGEVLIFTGTDPSNAANWKQQGRYSLSPPLGMNGHVQVGGDILILSVDGIIPLSQAITKDAGQLELAMFTRSIKRLWRREVNAKRSWAWTIKKWDEYGSLFVTTPGGDEGQQGCLVANNVTGGWSRFYGSYDATCFVRLLGSMFLGTQDGFIMQMDRGGSDDMWDPIAARIISVPYVATMVGGWETFGPPAGQVVWHQARASFMAGNSETFQPQLSATVDYVVTLPTPPPAGPDPGVLEVWDEGLWDQARWDQLGHAVPPVRNTLWVSIGQTGYAQAPIVQVQIAQTAPPDVELLAISALYEPAGVNV